MDLGQRRTARFAATLFVLLFTFTLTPIS